MGRRELTVAIVAALAVGTLVSVTVGVLTGMYAVLPYGVHEVETADWPRAVPDTWPTQYTDRVSGVTSLLDTDQYITSDGTAPNKRFLHLHIIRVGWPLRSMTITKWSEVINPEPVPRVTTDGSPVRAKRRNQIGIVPLRVLVGGMAVNSTIAGGLAFAPWALFVFARRKWRQRCGRCVRCGYTLVGVSSGLCPECGFTRSC